MTTADTAGEALFRIALSDDEIEKLNWATKVLSKTTDEVVEMFVKSHLKGIEIK